MSLNSIHQINYLAKKELDNRSKEIHALEKHNPFIAPLLPIKNHIEPIQKLRDLSVSYPTPPIDPNKTQPQSSRSWDTYHTISSTNSDIENSILHHTSTLKSFQKVEDNIFKVPDTRTTTSLLNPVEQECLKHESEQILVKGDKEHVKVS